MKARLVVALLVFIARSAESQLVLTPAERAAGIVKQFGCPARPFPVEMMRQPAEFQPLACALVTYAYRESGRGGARALKVIPTDTAAILRVVADQARIECRDETGKRLPRCDEDYWSVTMQLKGREATLRFFVDRRNGRTWFENSEPLPERLQLPIATSDRATPAHFR